MALRAWSTNQNRLNYFLFKGKQLKATEILIKNIFLLVSNNLPALQWISFNRRSKSPNYIILTDSGKVTECMCLSTNDDVAQGVGWVNIFHNAWATAADTVHGRPSHRPQQLCLQITQQVGEQQLRDPDKRWVIQLSKQLRSTLSQRETETTQEAATSVYPQ